MSRRTCAIIFIASVITIMVAYILNFSVITTPVSKTFSAMQGIYLSLAAVITSLVLLKQRYYWLMILGCAIVATMLIQWLVVGGTIFSLALLYKIAGFVVYAYLVQLMRYML